MPAVRVVDQATLQDTSGTQGAGTALGAYDAAGDVIYLSRELVEGDAAKAAAILTEEVGHGLDARLNTSDAAGDEGDIFARSVAGESFSEEELLTALRAENDSGTIVVDGKQIEVEYGLLGKVFGGVSKAFKKVKNAVKGAVEGAVDAVKGGFEAVMNNKLLGTVMSFAQFVPIPMVQLLARGYNLARSAYGVYQGVKHGSMSMVLGGAAGVFGGGRPSGLDVRGVGQVRRHDGVCGALHGHGGARLFRVGER